MRIVVLIALLSAASSASARPLPAAEWTPTARLWLTRALVGEAGWWPAYSRDRRGRTKPCEGADCYRNRDWEIIPFVLQKRWAAMRISCERRDYACHVSGRPFRFEEVIRKYCSPLKAHLASRRFERENRSKPHKIRTMHRRRFIQAIAWNGSNIPFLLHTYSKHTKNKPTGELYRDGWQAARRVAVEWGNGVITNPCPAAEHWDNVLPRGGKLQVVDCGETLNFYSAVVRKAKRDERRVEQGIVSTSQVHRRGRQSGQGPEDRADGSGRWQDTGAHAGSRAWDPRFRVEAERSGVRHRGSGA